MQKDTRQAPEAASDLSDLLCSLSVNDKVRRVVCVLR